MNFIFFSHQLAKLYEFCFRFAVQKSKWWNTISPIKNERKKVISITIAIINLITGIFVY